MNDMTQAPQRQRYSSPLMQERRQRILAEARALLAEAGETGFNIRDLSRRASVSSRTLYQTFGGREGILAHAITEHIEGLRQEWAATPLGGDLDSVLAEYDTIAIEVERNSAYLRVLVALYFSPAPIEAAIESIRSLPANRIGRWLAAAPKDALLPAFERARIVEQHVNSELITYYRWSVGRIALEDLADELRVGLLATLLSITSGPLRADLAERHTRICALLAARRKRASPRSRTA